MTNMLGFRLSLTLLWAVLWESFALPQLAIGFVFATLLTSGFARFRKSRALDASPEFTMEN